MSKLNKSAIITSIAGLAIIVIVIISEFSYPDSLFTHGTAIGMVMIFLSLLLYVARWCRDLFISVKEKNIVGILILIFVAILFTLNFIRR